MTAALPPMERGDAEVRRENLRLVRVAILQGRLIVIVAASVLLLPVLTPLLVYLLIPWAHPIAALVFVILLLTLPLVVTMTQLHRASSGLASAVVAAVLTVASLITCIGPMLVILIVNGTGTRALARRGLKVGFLGASASERRKLIDGICHACGYDLAGLAPGPCPECGKPFTRRPDAWA